MSSVFSDVWDKLLLALFPRRCALCGKVIAVDEELCGACLSLEKIAPPKCLLCGHSKADCSCKSRRHAYKSITAPFYYADSIIAAVHNLKFNEQPRLARKMGVYMAECVREDFAGVSFDLVTSVPMTRRRMNQRGYNQAELLGKSTADCLSLPYAVLLKKRFNNKVQRKESARSRRINVYGAFDVIESTELLGKTILLVDDVKTTGSTLNECAKMLKMHGAAAVYVAVFAVTRKLPADHKKT